MRKCEPVQVYYAAGVPAAAMIAYGEAGTHSSHVLIGSQAHRLQYMRAANNLEPHIHSGSLRADISRAYQQKQPLCRRIFAGYG